MNEHRNLNKMNLLYVFIDFNIILELLSEKL